jgi:hypothetical protein
MLSLPNFACCRFENVRKKNLIVLPDEKWAPPTVVIFYNHAEWVLPGWREVSSLLPGEFKRMH